MHDDSTRDQLASDRIRDAVPGLEDDARERIATKIAGGAVASGARRRRRTMMPRVRALRPVLVVGAAAVAIGVVLLAPGNDESDTGTGLLSLGPDPAAAEVLHAAGRTVSEQPWHAIRGDETWYARAIESGGQNRIARIQERWIAADGTVTQRDSEDPSSVADGDAFYVPAETCTDLDSLPTSPPVLRTVASERIGSMPPDCWTLPRSTNSTILRNATGVVIDAPPPGAAVYLAPWIMPTDGRALSFGSSIVERDSEAPVDGDPIRLSTDTTWVKVEADPIEFSTTSRSTGAGTRGGSILPTWMDAFSVAELDELPTTGDALRARLADAADHLLDPAATATEHGAPMLRELGLQRQDTMMLIATDLLASAPIAPEVRRATFEVLASLPGFGGAARVVDDVELKNGEPTIGIEYALPGTPGSTPSTDTALLLLDPASGQLVGREVSLGITTSATVWSTDRRDASRTPRVG
jgi:hypothetical protein